MKLLEVQDLSLSMGETPILTDVSLSVDEGIIHCVVGPNGAGKTTLAYSVMGLPGYAPEKGHVRFDGRDITGLGVDERARLGLTLAWQEPARFEGLSVRNFLLAGARQKSETGVRAALDRVALDPDSYLQRAVDKSLSGGERKRIELASILTMEPRLVIMDEPDSGIDIAALEKIFELLDELKNQGTAVMLVTHSPAVLARADEATLICCGRVVERAGADQVGDYFLNRCMPCPSHQYPPEGEADAAD